ncbi:MAG: PilZ domain-containing protein [Spirochaetales bacterium]|nr:PilZ domain-containing protein [Spirochaetales bacterium]
MGDMRTFPRLSLASDIEYNRISSEKVTGDAQGGVSKTKDISKGGICLITSEPLHKGDILHLKLRLQGIDTVIEAIGKVVWTESFEIGNQKGYDNGIEFIKIPDEFRKIIERFVNDMFPD